jgi:hypothetical protein
MTGLKRMVTAKIRDNPIFIHGIAVITEKSKGLAEAG